MPYTNIIALNDAGALIPEQVTNELITTLTAQSAALSLFRSVTMATNVTRMPVVSALPTAYFVQGETGLKQTTEVNWENKYLNVEELAAIVPVPEAVLADVQFDLWGSVMPLLVSAIGRALDTAIFFGTNKPASWPAAIVTDATAAGNAVTRAALAGAGGVAADLSALFARVEADGYDVNGVVASPVVRSYLRNARDVDGQPLSDIQGNAERIYGVPVTYAMRGLWPAGAGAAEVFAGDWTQMVLGVRQDFTWKTLDQAVIQDNTGAIVYNLAQQDLVALRVTFRVAWQVANPINYDQPAGTSRYPIGVLTAP